MADSCQVDFYVLAALGQSPEKLACRLAGMAWEQGHRIAVLTDDGTAAEALDRLMWEYPAGRFLPHARQPAPGYAPVSIETDDSGIDPGRDVVINLTERPVGEPGRFSRLLEIVPAEDKRRSASRQKFRHYRELGLDPASHTIEN